MRSGVTKMPLITASHRFAFSAGIRPGKAVFTGFATPPQVAASFTAMSTSKPLIAPLGDASSIGGDVGSVQYLNVVAWRLAPAVPAAARAPSRVSSESRAVGGRRCSSPGGPDAPARYAA